LASGTTAWSANVNLVAGPNLIEVKAVDSAGNESALASRTITNVLAGNLSVTINGQGTVTPDLNGQTLEIGQPYTVLAEPASGYAFSNWSGTVSATTAQLTFVMQSNMTLVANFYDNGRPSVAITSPAANARVTNSSVITVSGTASDNTGVAQVLYRVRGGAFQAASGTTSWSATADLLAGPNLIEVKSVDAVGNESTLASRTITNVVVAQLSLTVNGAGTVSPNLNGQWLEIGQSYTMTAQPSAGYAFSNWSGTISASTAQLTFVMQSNMTLVASFYDNGRPSVAITSPAANARVTNSSAITVSGTASDNTAVAQVLYRVRGGAFQLATGTTAWSATASLIAGPNLIEVKSVDTAGNESALASRTITNVVVGQLSLTVNGSGTVSPNLDGQWLEIGQSYTMTAQPSAGYAFSNWSGTVSATTAQLTFVMQSNMTLVANFYDNGRPSVVITSPAANARVTNSAAAILLGTASDNTGVAQVLYRVRGGAFQAASGATSWSATADLLAGPNLIEVKSVDTAGNESTLAARTITNVVVAQLSLTVNGSGTVSPNLNGQWLEIGQSYTMTAQPSVGFGFTNWSGTISASTAQLTFVMQSNMTLVANFIDVTRPTVAITSPATNIRVTNGVASVSGTASDNSELTQVLYRVRGGAFQLATGTTAWSATASLIAGPNLIEVKSVDTAGNESALASRTITNVVVGQLSLTVNGSGTVSPNLNGQWLEIGQSYTMTAQPSAGYAFSNWSGTISATSAQLTFVMQSNVTLVASFYDNGRPSVVITSPAANARITNSTTVTVAGTASDNTGVAQVLYRVRGGAFQAASGTTSWSATADLLAGPNLIEVKSVDTAGNESTLASRTITNVLAGNLSVTINGQGTVTPDLNGQTLEIGQPYTILAQPSVGYAFSNWSGTISASTAQLTFVLQSNMTLVANFIDVTRPTVAITSPATNIRVTNGVATISGTAADNSELTQVLYRVGTDAFQPATGTATWFATVNLAAGPNRVEVKSLDAAGNESLVASRTLTNVVAAQLSLTVNGAGTVAPNLDGDWLEIGQAYTVTAQPSAGYALSNWSGTISATTTQLTFVMQSNMTLVANFTDVGTPLVAFTYPTANITVTNVSNLTVQGTARDNADVTTVLYAVNEGAFQPANGTVAWWADIPLPGKTNLVRVKCVDRSGNESPVISRAISCYCKQPMRVAKRGKGKLTPDLSNKWLEVGDTYTMTAIADPGYIFSDWSGTIASTNPTITFVMDTNLTLTATFLDIARPTISVTWPTNNARATNASIAMRGRATDNLEVSEVWYSLNDGPFQLAFGTTNWTAPLVLDRSGPNIIRLKSVDQRGSESAVLTHTLHHAVRLPVSVSIIGRGTVTPFNGQALEIGKTYTALAKPGTGFIFTNWTGSVPTNRAQFSFVMQTNLALTANFIDVARPTVSFISPTNNARVTNGIVTLYGRAGDNRDVAEVWYSLNDGPFELATGTTNWSGTLVLRAGRNTVRAKSFDVTGFESLTVTQAVTYVVMAPIDISIIGRGTVTPANGQWLEIGKVYTAAAKPAVGFGLTNWSGSLPTTRTNFTFTMQSNLTFTAHFADVTRPVVSVFSPLPNARTTLDNVVFQGYCSDNDGIREVLYGLNDGPWLVATRTPVGWVAPPFNLTAGPNKLRVKAIDLSGLESRSLTQSVTYVVMWPMVAGVSGSGTITPNLNGQMLEIGKSYSMTAVPGPGYLLSNWVGTVYSEATTLSFIMRSNSTVTAQFAPNPFIPVKGNYNGLFYETSEVLHHSSGFLKVSLTDRGTFTASLAGGGVTVPFSGQFRLAGDYHRTLNRTGLPPVTVELHLDFVNGTEQLSGTVSDGSWTAIYLGDRSSWNTTNNPFQGRYSVVLPAASDPSAPAGHGYGFAIIDRAGNLVFSGKSGDGAPMTQAVPISRSGEWPMYVPLYGGSGSMLSWITFTNVAAEPMRGLLSWIRTPKPGSVYYPGGFSNDIAVASSVFTRPTATNKIANLDLIRVVASEGNLAVPVTNYVLLTAASKIYNTNGVNFTMALNATNGVFSGTFRVPGTVTTRSFYGALLQNRDAGYGYFLGTNQSGQVRLEPGP